MTGEIEMSDVRALTHVVGHHYRGYFGRSPLGSIVTPRSHNLIAALGDSTVEQIHLDSTKRNRSAYNHFYIGNALAGNRAIMTGNFGVSGERTDQTLARLDAALGSDAGTLYISEGINSIAQAPYTHAVWGLTIAMSSCGAQALADTMKKVDAGLALCMKVIVALCHGASSFTSQQIAQLAIYNGGLRRAAEVRANLWLLDVPAILHDPSTTPSSLQFRTGYMRSESPVVHEAGPGACYVGKEFAKILIDVMGPIPRNAIHRSNQRSPDNRTQLALNPLFYATSGNAGVLGGGGSLAAGTAAVPYEWTFSHNSGDSMTSFSVGVEPNAAGNGNDVVISYNVTTAGGGLRI